MKKLIFITFTSLLLLTGCAQKSEVTNSGNSEVKKEQMKSMQSDGDFINELALHDAVRAKDFDIVKDLVNNGMQVDTKDKYGYTPLHLAARLNQYDIAEFLINKGANVNNVDVFKDTPLLDSTRNGTNEMSRLLLCNGASPDVYDRHDMKPIHNASKNNDLYIVEMIESDDITKMCEKLDITLDEYIEDTNQICGKIVKGYATDIDLAITDESSDSVKPFGKYKAEFDSEKYCATLDKKPDLTKSYIVTAVGSNSIDKDIEIANLGDLVKKEEPVKSPYISGLYEDLMAEFGPDFEPWNAQLDKDGLVFRFKKPELLFSHGSSNIKNSYKKILDDFFPRYLKVIEKYKDQIKDIIVEGHTSSVYASAKTQAEKYAKNKILSEKRAKKVYDYTLSQEGPMTSENKDWLSSHYSYEGLSSDNLIYDANGKEDEALSRRVEFRINKIVE
ncbi:MAG: ankyrin repeat domain-containing protein [Halarcobacter sp.]